MRRKKPVIPHGVPRPPPEKIRAVLARNVRHHRYRIGMSAQRLADLSAVELLTIQRIEYKKNDILLATAARIRRALRINWKTFLSGL